MSPFKKAIVWPVLAVVSVSMLAACEHSGAPDSEESVLRIHDVSGLRVTTLDDKLNELLSREDLPLRGKVELLDDTRLAVNASGYLQDQISQMIDQLRDHAPAPAVERPFRIEFWLLRMAKAEGKGDAPPDVVEDLEPLLARHQGYSLSVEDYLESFHSTASSVNRIASGRGAQVLFETSGSSMEEVVIVARITARGQDSRRAIFYEVNHTLMPGKSLVLGRAHDGGDAEHASYQVLVARAEWADSAG